MTVNEVKQERQILRWSGIVNQRQESGLPVKEWC